MDIVELSVSESQPIQRWVVHKGGLASTLHPSRVIGGVTGETGIQWF